MNGNDFLDKMELIDPAFIEAAEAPKIKKPNWIKKYGTIAACLVLLVSIGFGTYAYAAEVKEYNKAVQFFTRYELSTEGLTRGEIKNVYRDITTNSFTYSKTAEVIGNRLTSDKIGGFEILQESPTPEDVENLWNYMNFRGGVTGNDQNGINYKYRFEYKDDNQLYLDKSYLEKYNGEILLWSVSVSEFSIYDHSIVSDGVIIYGENDNWSSLQKSYAWVAKIDNNGELLWKRMLDHGFKNEYIASVLENDDGSLAILSRGDFEYLCLSKYSEDGKELHFQKNEVSNYGISNAVRFGDGYLVQLWSYLDNEYAKIVKLDCDGNLTDAFSYGVDDAYYYITDMIEFNGSIYLSAYAVPKLADEDQNAGGRYEIAAVLNYIHNKKVWSIPSEELTPVLRDNYTAMLLVCNSSSGEPQEFYSVKGSLGGKLSVSGDGDLLWDVESITTSYYSPATSSFSIGGTCYVFRYTFGKSGALISQEKTGEVTNYRR